MARRPVRAAAGAIGSVLALALALAACAAPIRPIMLPGDDVFPESVTVLPEGALAVGSAGTGAIWRARPGDRGAHLWLAPSRTGLRAVLGVFADRRHGLLWVCSRPPYGAAPPAADGYSALRAFDLATGDPRRTIAMPGGAADVCNDIAVAVDGSVYVAETAGGRIMRLAPGAAALHSWLRRPEFAGIDGIAVGADGNLYVSSVTTGRVFRVAIGADGGPGAPVELAPSRPLDRPDGLRAIGEGRLLVSEAGRAGGISELTLDGDRLVVRRLAGSAPGTTSAAALDGVAWGVEARLAYRRDPALRGADPGRFMIRPTAMRPPRATIAKKKER